MRIDKYTFAYYMRFMNTIRHIRTNIFGVSQTAFAKIAGVKQASVSRWESSNDSSAPTLAEMVAIRNAALDRGLNWNDSYFFQSDEPVKQHEEHPA